MMNISILVPNSSVMQAIADPQYLFTTVNQFLIASGQEQLFNVQLVAADKQVNINDGLFSITASHLLEEVDHTDLIIIPALFGDMKNAIQINEKLVPWINKHYF